MLFLATICWGSHMTWALVAGGAAADAIKTTTARFADLLEGVVLKPAPATLAVQLEPVHGNVALMGGAGAPCRATGLVPRPASANNDKHARVRLYLAVRRVGPHLQWALAAGVNEEAVTHAFVEAWRSPHLCCGQPAAGPVLEFDVSPLAEDLALIGGHGSPIRPAAAGKPLVPTAQGLATIARIRNAAAWSAPTGVPA